MKKGDTVKIKATGQEAEVVFASTILEENFYLLMLTDGSVPRDSFGNIKEFFSADLDYTDEQKEAFQAESYEHEMQAQATHPDYYNI